MKRCPQCNTDYFDNMLEFCLDDGTRLISVSSAARTAETDREAIATAETEVFSTPATFKGQEIRELGRSEPTVIRSQLPTASEKTVDTRVLEFAPIVLALAHNWWQWLYVNEQYIPSIPAFLISANFIMWLVLLAAGIAVSIYALKQNANKPFAYTSLVILAINLILFLVPRR